MKTIFLLKQPGDCEGRSLHVIGYFLKESDAVEVGATGFGSSYMGLNSPHIQEALLYEDLTDFCAANPMYESPEAKAQRVVHLRAAALAKLTPAEREALGL